MGQMCRGGSCAKAVESVVLQDGEVAAQLFCTVFFSRFSFVCVCACPHSELFLSMLSQTGQAADLVCQDLCTSYPHSGKEVTMKANIPLLFPCRFLAMVAV